MVGDPAFALQTTNFDRGYLAIILENLSDLLIDIFHVPCHIACMRRFVIDLENSGEGLSKCWVKVELLARQRVVRLSIHFHYELVLWVGLKVDPHT